MEKDDSMRNFMEQLFPLFYSRFFPNLVNIATPNSFNPFGCITKDFFQKIVIILSAKQSLVLERWRKFVANYCLKVSSHEMYLECIIYASVIESAYTDGIFDCILNISALVIAFNIEMLEKTGLDFCELSVDIFMVIYENILKEEFWKQGFFERFTIYISHEYLAWVRYLNGDTKDSDVMRIINKNKEQKEITSLQLDSITYHVIRKTKSCIYAKEVILNTKVTIPALPSSTHPNAIQKQEIARLEETKQGNAFAAKSVTTASASKSGTTVPASKIGTMMPLLQSYSSPDNDSQENIVVEDKSNIEWCDNIVRAVMNYNNSKNSNLPNGDERIQKVDETLGHLKDTIKYLLELLED